MSERNVSDMVWHSTEKGEEFYEKNEDALELPPTRKVYKMLDLLLAIDAEYYIMDPKASIKENYESYAQQYEDTFDVETPTTFVVFNEAIKLGLIEAREVVWG